MRNRTCERRDEDVAKVAVNKTKCNGSDVEELGNGKLTATLTVLVPKFLYISFQLQGKTASEMLLKFFYVLVTTFFP